MALPHHVQLHRGLPPWHPGDPGDPGGQARADVRALILQASTSAWRASILRSDRVFEGNHDLSAESAPVLHCHTSPGCLVYLL